MTKLLERETVLARLHAQLDGASAGAGRLVFIEGEAGIGKTALLHAFTQSVHDRLPVFWGNCDALQTPRPLGPLDDIAAQSKGELKRQFDASAQRHSLFVAFLDLLAAQPSVVVLEDLHWADSATLDLLRYAGRRVARTRSLLLGSFRNDELVPAHPLRGVLGDLATLGMLRLTPQSLSIDAVRDLSGDQGALASEVHRKTGGNPFFVTELLATCEPGVPATVQDAVIARAARLSPAARDVLDTAAVAGPRVEPWLLQALTVAESVSIDECLATGVLRSNGGALMFRHELARQAVLQAMTPLRARDLHRRVLIALLGRDCLDASAPLLAHHADGAGDAQVVRKWAPVAAQQAAAVGAHRQAAEHWASALKYTLAGARAPLLDEYAYQVQMSGGLAAAMTARREAARLWQEHGEAGNAAVSLARLALLLVLAGRNAEGEAVLCEATALISLSDITSSGLVVRLCSATARALDHDYDEAIALATVTLAEAQQQSNPPLIVESLLTLGIAMMGSGRVDQGILHLEQSLTLAETLRLDQSISRALANLGSMCGEIFKFDLAQSYLRRGINFCSDRDLDAPRLYQLAWVALVRTMKGQWDEAATAAHEVIADSRATTIARIMALVALGRLRARRGDVDVWQVLDEARDLATSTGTLQRVAPMRAARAEAAWLQGRRDDAVREAQACLDMAVRKHHVEFAAELALWCAWGGSPTDMPAFCAKHPFALEAAGRWQDAAVAWRELGCPYETARALAAGNETAQREALAIFELLGARPMVERVRHALRAAGARAVPYGPRDSTRQHPCGLTGKEVAVLALLASGLRNKEIAQRLSRSIRTVDHHVQAIFTKLDVSNRAHAVSAAHRLGVVPRGAG